MRNGMVRVPVREVSQYFFFPATTGTAMWAFDQMRDWYGAQCVVQDLPRTQEMSLEVRMQVPCPFVGAVSLLDGPFVHEIQFLDDTVPLCVRDAANYITYSKYGRKP